MNRIKEFLSYSDTDIFIKILSYIDQLHSDNKWIEYIWYIFPKFNFWSKENIYKHLTEYNDYSSFDKDTIRKINKVYMCISENLSFIKEDKNKFISDVYDTLVDLSGIESEIKKEYNLKKKWKNNEI